MLFITPKMEAHFHVKPLLSRAHEQNLMVFTQHCWNFKQKLVDFCKENKIVGTELPVYVKMCDNAVDAVT